MNCYSDVLCLSKKSSVIMQALVKTPPIKHSPVTTNVTKVGRKSSVLTGRDFHEGQLSTSAGEGVKGKRRKRRQPQRY